ncbi:ATP-dependent DNA helicase [Mycena chlorophos]|uniref:ATP-dependent DNA helicase n=1 Tax=Mycena chlorophos TaxID=658473 RepID=A0A8H6VW50_MYCCL|nr:ATP-dependent DNA helicase [Mycena chlorophos]
MNFRKPPLALANNMWIGSIPFQLRILSLAERLLISIHFPVAYVVKLYAKDGSPVVSKRGTAGQPNMPRPTGILASVVAVTFVGKHKNALAVLPKIFRVRRKRIEEALLWLKENNHLYSTFNISDEALTQIPLDGVPEEIISNARYSPNVASTIREHASHVPEDGTGREEDGEEDTSGNEDNAPRANIPESLLRDDERSEDGDEEREPELFPLHMHGVVGVDGDEVTETDLFGHATENIVPQAELESHGVRRGSAFVNEHARLDEHDERCDGGPGNANHMLGAYPVLFPHGRGGIEVDRDIAVSYEAHARWALELEDARFRRDLHFMFQAFGILQKAADVRCSRPCK